MTDYMQKSRDMVATHPQLNNILTPIQASYVLLATTLEALDTERAAHESTKAELQALREDMEIIRDFSPTITHGWAGTVRAMAAQALTRKDA